MIEYRRFQLAGIIGESGDFKRPMLLGPSGRAIPDVILIEGDGAALEWEWNVGPEAERRHSHTRELLDPFIRLADAPDKAFLDFARHYGVLFLCQHGIPVTSPHGWSGCRPSQAEPLARWRLYARQARAVLRIAAALHLGNIGDDADWKTLYADNSDTPQPVPWWTPSNGADRMALSDVVNEMLVWGGVHPSIWWWPQDARPPGQPDSPTIYLDGEGVWSAVATQLLFAVAASPGIAICNACGQPYFPERKPARGRRNYCQTCRVGHKSHRDAAREWWRRNRAKSMR